MVFTLPCVSCHQIGWAQSSKSRGWAIARELLPCMHLWHLVPDKDFEMSPRYLHFRRTHARLWKWRGRSGPEQRATVQKSSSHAYRSLGLWRGSAVPPLSSALLQSRPLQLWLQAPTPPNPPATSKTHPPLPRVCPLLYWQPGLNPPITGSQRLFKQFVS